MLVTAKKFTLLSTLAIVLGMGMAACQQGGQETLTTSDGVRYTKHTEAEGEFPDSTSIIDMHYQLYTPTDSLISSTYQAPVPSPMPFRFEQAPYMKEPLSKVTGGDSITLQIPAKLMFQQGQIPPFLKADDEVRMEIKVEGIYQMEEYQQIMAERRQQQQQKMQQLIEESKVKEDADIQEYLTANSMEADKTESGLYYISTTPGDTSNIESGDTVVVHYRGTLLDGTPFDNSYDRGEPLRFPIKQGRVIKGWDEGIPLIGKGGKGTLLVPSHLAYGPSKRSDVIDAFSTLKFEVEVLDVVKKTEDTTEE